MATTNVALLRGINVGKAKRVAMSDLRSAMESLGYSDVQTLLASGNVVFTSARSLPKQAAVRMQEALIAKTGVSSRFTVLPATELAAIVAGNRLAKRISEPSRGFVTFVQPDTSLAALTPLLRKDWRGDELAIGDRVVYTWCPRGLLESDLMEAIAKSLGDNMTVRNWATTTKLLALSQRQIGVRLQTRK